MTTDKKDQDESKGRRKGRGRKNNPQEEVGGEVAMDRQERLDVLAEEEGAEKRPGRSPEEGPSARPVKNDPWDEYVFQVYFDKADRQFVGTVLEFPEIKAVGTKKEFVLAELEQKLEHQLFHQKKRNEPLPEPFHAKNYPSKIEVEISQGLYRKLDILSRYEKMPIDRLVVELIATALGKRFDSPGNRGHHSDRHEHRGQNRNQQNYNNQNQRNQGGRRGQHNRNYHETMDSRENFLEYVRNLEKGNTGGGWRKK